MHIKYLEEEIDEEIAAIEARKGYTSMQEVRALKNELELWELLREYKEHKEKENAAMQSVGRVNQTGTAR